MWVFDERVRELGDMHQSILMNANIDERAERGNIRHNPFKAHAFFQIGNFIDAFFERGCLELGPWVTPRLFELGQYVFHRWNTEPIIGKTFGPQLRQEPLITNNQINFAPCLLGNLLDNRVSLWMHSRGIKRVRAIHYPQEASGHLVGFRAKSRYLL